MNSSNVIGNNVLSFFISSFHSQFTMYLSTLLCLFLLCISHHFINSMLILLSRLLIAGITGHLILDYMSCHGPSRHYMASGFSSNGRTLCQNGRLAIELGDQFWWWLLALGLGQVSPLRCEASSVLGLVQVFLRGASLPPTVVAVEYWRVRQVRWIAGVVDIFGRNGIEWNTLLRDRE